MSAPTQRPAGAGWRGDMDDDAPPLTSMCFSLNAHVHSMSLAPGDGWCLVCGMKDGAVRLFNLLPSGNSWPDDRWGHELGRFESSSGEVDQLDLHVEVSSDGQHVFAGPRRRSTRLTCWNLPQARGLIETVGFALSSALAEAREGSLTLSHVHGGLRGLGAVATVYAGEQYRLLTGLGTKTLHVWNLIIYHHQSSSPAQQPLSADWSCIMSKSVAGDFMGFVEFRFLDNGTRALTRVSGQERCVRVWNLDDSALLGNNNSDHGSNVSGTSDDGTTSSSFGSSSSLGSGGHQMKAYHDLRHTQTALSLANASGVSGKSGYVLGLVN